MILGHFRDHLPRVTLPLPGSTGPLPVLFIVDTGFEGDLALPSNILHQLDTQPLFLSLRALGDGTLRECSVHQLVWEWNDEPRTVEVLVLEHNPLLGTMLLEGCHLAVDMTEGGEVVIELPD
jgi:clan AA aspartic protease